MMKKILYRLKTRLELCCITYKNVEKHNHFVCTCKEIEISSLQANVQQLYSSNELNSVLPVSFT